jgi:hypothetical protein
MNSAKFICRIVHRSPSERREDGFLGPPRHVSEIYILWWCIKMQAEEYSACGERPLFVYVCHPEKPLYALSKKPHGSDRGLLPIAEVGPLDRVLGGTTTVRHQRDGTVLGAAGVEEVLISPVQRASGGPSCSSYSGGGPSGARTACRGTAGKGIARLAVVVGVQPVGISGE